MTPTANPISDTPTPAPVSEFPAEVVVFDQSGTLLDQDDAERLLRLARLVDDTHMTEAHDSIVTDELQAGLVKFYSVIRLQANLVGMVLMQDEFGEWTPRLVAQEQLDRYLGA